MSRLTTGKNPQDQCYFDSECVDLCWGAAMQTSLSVSSKVCERYERWIEKCAFPGDPYGKASRKENLDSIPFHESKEEPCCRKHPAGSDVPQTLRDRPGIRQFGLREVERVPPPPPSIALESTINYFM